MKLNAAFGGRGGSTAEEGPASQSKRIPKSEVLPRLRLGRPEEGPLQVSIPSAGVVLCCFRLESSRSGASILAMICVNLSSRLEIIEAVSFDRIARSSSNPTLTSPRSFKISFSSAETLDSMCEFLGSRTGDLRSGESTEVARVGATGAGRRAGGVRAR